ncbi:hypothetical protein BDY21DRAFT_420731 [Lineolata rhizophorae]|uniref:C3H1-type domain-containing protein n=1 Tax=Lineolata rhizophorae TaxID=578093 RepID=A0A6A6P474_9PEZI|nr:hypothetical protein BDY21DRAFT_420731 [Lineolata rhizophorae]
MPAFTSSTFHTQPNFPLQRPSFGPPARTSRPPPSYSANDSTATATNTIALASNSNTEVYPTLRPQFYLTRGPNHLTPLVAADELPLSVQLRGVPRAMTAELAQVMGMTCVGEASGTGRVYGLESGVLGEVGREHDKKEQALDPAEQERNDKAREGSSAQRPDVQSLSHCHFYCALPYTILARKPDPEKKEYCTYWIRTGECDYTQQGCLYKHEMPDKATLARIGFRGVPRWWAEKHAVRMRPILSENRTDEGARSSGATMSWRRLTTTPDALRQAPGKVLAKEDNNTTSGEESSEKESDSESEDASARDVTVKNVKRQSGQHLRSNPTAPKDSKFYFSRTAKLKDADPELVHVQSSSAVQEPRSNRALTCADIKFPALVPQKSRMVTGESSGDDSLIELQMPGAHESNKNLNHQKQHRVEIAKESLRPDVTIASKERTTAGKSKISQPASQAAPISSDCGSLLDIEPESCAPSSANIKSAAGQQVSTETLIGFLAKQGLLKDPNVALKQLLGSAASANNTADLKTNVDKEGKAASKAEKSRGMLASKYADNSEEVAEESGKTKRKAVNQKVAKKGKNTAAIPK